MRIFQKILCWMGRHDLSRQPIDIKPVRKFGGYATEFVYEDIPNGGKRCNFCRKTVRS